MRYAILLVSAVVMFLILQPHIIASAGGGEAHAANETYTLLEAEAALLSVVVQTCVLEEENHILKETDRCCSTIRACCTCDGCSAGFRRCRCPGGDDEPVLEEL